MLNYYISELKDWWSVTGPVIINEQNFLLIVGSLFLLGVVTKWVVVKNYGRLIRKAENINNTRNYTIRQIKTKYDSIKQVNKTVENPQLFVHRNIDKCKIMHISVNKVNNTINWCALFIMGVAAILSFRLYKIAPVKMDWVSYLVLGTFLAVALEMVNRMMPAAEKKTELICTLADVLANGSYQRNARERDTLIELVPETEDRTKVVYNESEKVRVKNPEEEQRAQETKEEEILNQVIGDFLQ